MMAEKIECSDQPLDLSFHPSNPQLVAVALVDGTVEVHECCCCGSQRTSEEDEDDEDEDDTLLSSTVVHTQLLPNNTNTMHASKKASCRAVEYSADGQSLWTGGSGGDVTCLDAAIVGTFSVNQNHQKPIRWRIPDAAAKSPIQVLHELPSQRLLVTGDEAGCVRVWDPRLLGSRSRSSSSTKSSSNNNKKLPVGCVASWKEHEDYISALEHNVNDNANTLLATSADGTLSVYDLRAAANNQSAAAAAVRKSDNQEDELLSLKIIKNGKKVVCGTGEGVLSVFSYGTWGDVSDRFPGHPASIDALVKVDEDTLLTGASDGLIRVVSIHPDKFVGVIGDNHEGFPIEKLQFNADRSLLGSVTHDHFVRLCDARVLQEDYEDDEDVKMAPAAAAVSVATAATASGTTAKSGIENSDEEWEDMDLEDEDLDDDSDDDDDSSDDEGERPQSKNDKRAGRLKTDAEKFFADL